MPFYMSRDIARPETPAGSTASQFSAFFLVFLQVANKVGRLFQGRYGLIMGGRISVRSRIVCGGGETFTVKDR